MTDLIRPLVIYHANCADGFGGGGHRNASVYRVPRDHELATS